MSNFILRTDGYKASHHKMYPAGLSHVYSYMCARNSATIFFGLQYILKKYFVGGVVDINDIHEAEAFFNQYMGKGVFNRDGWWHIVSKYHGRLPLHIRAIREGNVAEYGEPIMTIENTDPEVPWLTNYVETLLLQVWYPCTVATISNNIKRKLLLYRNLTGGVADENFQLHDFGYRGVSSVESAGIGGAAHLINFKGTDTLEGITCLTQYYGNSIHKHWGMPGFSIPAAEHSTVTSWGRNHEADAFEHVLKQFPDGVVAVVSDSYNIFDACKKLWGELLRDKVLSRHGTLVIRPDSGDPVETTLRCLAILGDRFGYTMNAKGYRTLPPQVRLIWGDGIDEDGIASILYKMSKDGWCSDNIAFGMGGALLQKVNRDTLGFAIKCSSVTVNGVERDVYKSPIGSSGKASRRGRFNNRALETVFENGELVREQEFDDIRTNIDSHIHRWTDK